MWIFLFGSIHSFQHYGLHIELLQYADPQSGSLLLMFPSMGGSSAGLTPLASLCPLTYFFLWDCRDWADWAVWELGPGRHNPPLSSLFYLGMSCPQETLVQWQTGSLRHQWGGESLLCAALLVTTGQACLFRMQGEEVLLLTDINHILQSQHYQ